jgi:hypothetical protein
MKKIICLCCVLLTGAILGSSQNMPELKSGTVLTYRVISGELTYNFVVTLVTLSDKIEFSWKMEAPVNQKGSITIMPDAVANAGKYMNNFSPGDQILQTESSVFISNANFKEIIKKSETHMDMGNGNTGMWNGGSDNFSFTYRGEEIFPYAYYLGLKNDAQTLSGYREVVVAKTGKYHLILSMTLDFDIRLMTID